MTANQIKKMREIFLASEKLAAGSYVDVTKAGVFICHPDGTKQDITKEILNETKQQ